MMNTAIEQAAEPVLDVRNLSVSFRTDEGVVQAVENLDFAAYKGRTLGIVGESGSGKSVSTKACIRLLPRNAVIPPDSRITLKRKDGKTIDVTSLSPGSRTLRRIRGGEIGMIFQEPMASFSPVYTIGNQMSEAIRLHRSMNRAEAREFAEGMLARVGIFNPSMCFDQYVHELSGGMRQRAMIAMTLAMNPSILVADEPTTALDVTIQAQILDLMRELQDEFDMSMIFITHDMAIIAQVADEIAVMYLGRILERGPAREVIRNPQHPYTQGLLQAIPSLKSLKRRLTPIAGDIPSPLERPQGCPFHTRCIHRIKDRCDQVMPAETHATPLSSVRCHLYGESTHGC